MKERPILFSAPMVRAILEGRKTQTRRVVKLPEAPDSVEWGNPTIIESGEEAPGPERFGAWGEDWNVRCPYGGPGDRLWVRETWGYRGCGWTNQRPAEHSYRIEYQADAARKDFTFMGATFAEAEPPGIPQQPETATLTRDATVEEQMAYHEALNRYWRAWRPSIHMPRWASRITLEVTGVRVERLQDISEEDARAEGLKGITKDGKLVKYGIPDRDGLPGTDNDGWEWQDWSVDPREAYRRLWNTIHADRDKRWFTRGESEDVRSPWVWVIEFRRIEEAKQRETA